MFVDDTCAHVPEPPLDLGLKLRTAQWNADVARSIRQMVTDKSASSTRALDDLNEGVHGLRFARSRIARDPLIHFRNVPRRSIDPQKLCAVLSPPLDHKLGLSTNRANPTGNLSMGMRKFSLQCSYQVLDIDRAKLACRT
jgi:hypothetical protein